MREIFIATEAVDTSVEDEIAKLEEQSKEFEAIAAHAEWLDTQSEIVKELATELATVQTDRKMCPRFTVETTIVRGRTIHTASCANGVHQSLQSPEHAVFLMVDSFRTREEDKPEIHERIKAHGGDIKNARRVAAQIAKTVRERSPGLSGEEYDALVLKALDQYEADLEATLGSTAPGIVPPLAIGPARVR